MRTEAAGTLDGVGRTAAPAWERLLRLASEPYRAAGRFAYHFARGKLSRDPVFRHVLASGLVPSGSAVLDIGCGQGLLASLLLACDQVPAADWPRHWAAAPRGVTLHGIDFGARDIARAQAALGSTAPATFACEDMRHAAFAPADVVVLLDVLHYVGPDEQLAVLRRARQALRPHGTLVLRVADAGAGGRFLVGHWVDAAVARLRGHARPQAGRTRDAWIAELRALGLHVRAEPMSGGTPFANVLLVARDAAGRAGA